jgi:hypothetical protein
MRASRGDVGAVLKPPSFRKTTGVLTFAEPAVREVDHTLCRHHL